MSWQLGKVSDMSVTVADIDRGIGRIDDALVSYKYSNSEQLYSLRAEGIYMLKLVSVLSQDDLDMWNGSIRQACFMASRSQFA